MSLNPHEIQASYECTPTTELARGVTLEGLSNKLRPLNDKEYIAKYGVKAFNEFARPYRDLMMTLPEALDDLAKINGSDYSPETTLPDDIILDFQDHMMRGIDIYMSNTGSSSAFTREGLHKFLTYILTNDHVGMVRYLPRYKLLNKPEFLFARIVFLLNVFFDKIRQCGILGDLILEEYVKRYFSRCVSGYGHTLETWIAHDGRPLYGEAFSARSGDGLAYCVVYGLKDCLQPAIQRYNELQRDRAPPQPMMSLDEYDSAYQLMVDSLLENGYSQQKANDTVRETLGPRPSHIVRADNGGRILKKSKIKTSKKNVRHVNKSKKNIIKNVRLTKRKM